VQALDKLRPGRKPSLDIHIHGHYRLELEQLLAKSRWLDNSRRYDVKVLVYVTEALADPELQALAPNATFVRCSSSGRNFGSLIQARMDGHLVGDYVMHVHTKKSPHLPFGLGRAWFAYLSRSVFARAASKKTTLLYYPRLEFMFSRKSRVLWSPDGFFRKPELVRSPFELSKTLNFPAGGMFFSNGALLRQWLDLVISAEPIFDDVGQLHGAAEHYLERFLGAFAETYSQVESDSKD